MVDSNLRTYIQTNLQQGFDQGEIRTALLEAGWSAVDVDQAFNEGSLPTPAHTLGFFQKFRKILVTAVVVVVSLGVLGIGGYFAYLKYAKPKKATVQGVAISSEEELSSKQRDQQRILDVTALQFALHKFYSLNQFYPKTLEALTSQGFFRESPLDPKIHKPYVYTAFGNPSFSYSLAFLLEERIGNLDPGLQVVSSEAVLQSEQIVAFEALVQGGEIMEQSQEIQITELSAVPFYPREEVRMDIWPTGKLDLTSARLVTRFLDLLDSQNPLRFTFTAPAEPGTYLVKVYVFDASGHGYSRHTSLVVNPGNLLE